MRMDSELRMKISGNHSWFFHIHFLLVTSEVFLRTMTTRRGLVEHVSGHPNSANYLRKNGYTVKSENGEEL